MSNWWMRRANHIVQNAWKRYLISVTKKTMKKIKMKTHITIIESRRSSPDGKQGGGDGKDGLNKSADAMPLSYGKAK
jgi:hypothetical protein